VDVEALSGGVVGNKVYTDDGNRLETAQSSVNTVRVHVLMHTGSTNYKPAGTINGVPIIVVGEETPEHKMAWLGYADIVLDVTGDIFALHEDSANDSATITVQAAPEVVSAVFTPNRPNRTKRRRYFSIICYFKCLNG
jgi:hypothetical protein